MDTGRLFRRLTAVAALGAMLGAAPALAQGLAPPTAAEAAASIPPERARSNQRVFDHVWNEVRREYYDPGLHGVDWEEARRTWRPLAMAARDDRSLYRSLRGMLDLLDDDHAGVSPPAVARRQDRLRERRAALGVTLRPDPSNENRYLIERVREDSPAAEAGIAAGWRLLIEGDAAWSPEHDVVEGQPVSLTLIDEAGAARALVVHPRVLEPRPAFTVDRSREGVVVLTIEGFEQGLGRWIGDQLADVSVETDVILDLRGNPGGRLLEADAVLSCFLPAAQPWATRTPRNGRRILMKTGGGCGALNGPIANDVAVLVDEQSRSAAELTPAALQEARRALVVGAPTAGAVLISQETRLPDGGRLTLSRADFVTSGGVRLEKRGVTPDILAAGDLALEAAISALAARSPERAEAAPAAF
ncbi:MAG TPA: S41 family peptidase [Brevundimonas sp.]|nr:S41 family peptidase [Brevundimonas sp.]